VRIEALKHVLDKKRYLYTRLRSSVQTKTRNEEHYLYELVTLKYYKLQGIQSYLIEESTMKNAFHSYVHFFDTSCDRNVSGCAKWQKRYIIHQQ